MPWSCLRCETSNSDQNHYCQVCDFERRFTSTEVATLVRSASQPGVGGSVRVHPARPRKSAGVALVLSFLVTGLGQLYLGQVGKGVFLFVMAVFLGLASWGLLGLAVWFLSMVDAYKLGKKSAQGLPVGKWDFL